MNDDTFEAMRDRRVCHPSIRPSVRPSTRSLIRSVPPAEVPFRSLARPLHINAQWDAYSSIHPNVSQINQKQWGEEKKMSRVPLYSVINGCTTPIVYIH